jgi:hypothetical protein
MIIIAVVAILLAQASPTLGIPAPETGAHGSPITMNDCAFIYRSNVYSSWIYRLRIEFTNESPKTADLVTFAVKSDVGSATIRDVGTYEPGAETTHEYRQFYGTRVYGPNEDLHCAVQAIHFTDGTVWQNGSNPGGTVAMDSPLGLVLESRESGVYVKFVAPGSPGEAAGIRQDDRIVSIGANTVGSVNHVRTILSMTSPGTAIPMLLDRDGQTVKVTVKQAVSQP